MVEENYPIDKRIYVTGHSNGAMMTQRLMRFWPQKFAGFAPSAQWRAGTWPYPTPMTVIYAMSGIQSENLTVSVLVLMREKQLSNDQYMRRKQD